MGGRVLGRRFESLGIGTTSTGGRIGGRSCRRTISSPSGLSLRRSTTSARWLKADGFLDVDGRVIYQMNDFTLKAGRTKPMRYSRVFIEAIGYELPPVVVTSDELEGRLKGVYEALKIPRGQLESLTGIVERRWWDPGYPALRGGGRGGQARALRVVGPAQRRRRPDLCRGLPRAVRARHGLPGRGEGRRQQRTRRSTT